MWQSHKLVVQHTDHPCFRVIQSLAAAAADNRSRALRLIFGPLPEGRDTQAHAMVFSGKWLWRSQDGIYLFLPGGLAHLAGSRWITFSKKPMVRAGMTLADLAAIHHVRIQWSHRRSAWMVCFLYLRQPLVSSRERVYLPHDQEEKKGTHHEKHKK